MRTSHHVISGTQPRKRASVTALAHHGTVDMSVGLDHHALAQGAVLDHAVRADHHVIFDDHTAFEDHVDVDQHVATNGDFATHVETCRVTQSHASRRSAVDGARRDSA